MVCYSCLRVGHLSKDCKDKIRCDKDNSRDKIYGRFHHPQIHNAFDRDTDARINVVNNS